MANVLLALYLAAVGATSEQVGQWTLISERRGDDLIRVVSEFLPRAQRETEEKLGLPLTARCTIVFCASLESFERVAPGFDRRHTLGVAQPEHRTMYLNCQAIESNPFESLAITLRHELSHLIVGEVVRRGFRHVPLWFDEGVAVWSSGKVPFYDPEDFERAAAAGTLPRLADLAGGFPSDLRERGIAYEASESFVRFLARGHGRDVVGRILRSAVSGADFPAAIHEATGTDVETLEAQWVASLRGRWPWLTWAFHAFSLFSAMSLLALVAFWIYWRRRRQKFKEWDMEESLESEGDPRWP